MEPYWGNLSKAGDEDCSNEVNTVERRAKMVSGNIVDVLSSEIYPGTLRIADGRIVDIIRDHNRYDTYIMPGFVDSHVHIESSTLIPSEFARAAVVHGTVATVSDPHEIANVLGVDGVRYMMENSTTVPVKFYFGAPSCVPASAFETTGAVVSAEYQAYLITHHHISRIPFKIVGFLTQSYRKKTVDFLESQASRAPSRQLKIKAIEGDTTVSNLAIEAIPERPNKGGRERRKKTANRLIVFR